ncbi:hypothetical protein [Nitrogeniibacter aestuarii]|uniref:hypothetical protein n=1 Tax=Nitrogeniibacter aestuarii TaxID=2815343 RepID=UPI001E3D634A|nr:hypothetical protein [Nitrogeniibacter aestuarii]
MVVRTLLIGLSLALAGCASGPARLDTTHLSAVYIADFTSSDPKGCTTADVDLTHDEAHVFFRRARQLSEKALADHYPLAPCRIEGTLKHDGQPCDFDISAAMTGSITCGERRWFFACEDCGDLFGP